MPGSSPARRLSRRRRSLDPETMIVDLMRDTVGENDENARRRAANEAFSSEARDERLKRPRVDVAASRDDGSAERSDDRARSDRVRGLTQDSARFSRHSGAKTPERLETLLDDVDDEALAEVAARLSAERSARSRSRTTDDARASRGNEASTSIERPVTAMGRRDLEFWGVPESAREALAAKGVRELYPWQMECLSLPGVMEGRVNLLYSAPTSGGKSLVADLLLMRRFRERPGSVAMFVLPFVALCEERADSLENLFAGTEFRLRRMYGGRGGAFPSDSKMNTLLVLTPERANQVTSRLLEENRLHELSAVIVDELHLIQDDDRGATMELFLTKLVYASGLWRRKARASGEPTVGDEDGSQTTYSVGNTRGGTRDQRSMQIIGMSASIPNLKALADWLFARLYVTSFRPIRLEVCVKVGCEIFHPATKHVIRTMLNKSPNSDNAHIAELAQETIDEDGSVLVFCSTRAACKTLADQLRNMMQCTVPRQIHNATLSRDEIVVGYETALGAKSDVLPYIKDGVAFHHAGLSREENEAVADAYKRGVIRVLCCTSTLATGVNLPARRVILRDTNMGWKKLNARDIQQMTGRAGRAGLDTSGSAIIFCPKLAELDNVCALVDGPSDELTSAVAEVGMRRIMLEAVAAGLVKTPTDVQDYVKCTLLSALNDFDESVRQTAIDALRWCQKNALLVWNVTAYLWSASALGNAVAGGMMPLDQVQPIIRDVKTAREDLVLSTPLHLLYLLTAPPVLDDEGAPMNLNKFRTLDALAVLWSNLNAEQLRIAEKVGIDERYVQRLRSNKRDITIAHQLQRFACQRFHVALFLTDLIQEVPIESITSKYGVRAFDVLEEQKSCARFASYVAAICGTLGWGDMEGLINRISDRITAGAQEEILELTKIPYIGIHRARALYTGGITTPKAIVTLGSVDKIAAVLKQYNKNSMAPSAIVRAAREILARAREIVAEQTREEREEAETRLAEIREIEAGMANENSLDLAIELDVRTAVGTTLLETSEDIETFLSIWQDSSAYSVIFQPKIVHESSGERRAFEEPTRIAVALNSRAVFIAKLLYDRHEQKNAIRNREIVGIPIARALEILSKEGPRKFTIDLQSQLCNIVDARASTYAARLFCFAQPCVDVRIAAWLLRPSADEVKASAHDALMRGTDPTDPLMKLFSAELGEATSGVEAACHIVDRFGKDRDHLKPLSRATAACYAMGHLTWKECQEKELLRPLMEIEMPFVAPIVAMQTVRIPFDARKMREEMATMDDRLKKLEEYALTQKWIVLDSSVSIARRALTNNTYLQDRLYKHLKLTPPPGAKTSIDANNLRKLYEQSNHPFPLLIIEHRSVFKRRGFADTILGMYADDSRIRYSIFQTNHDCGRLAHSEPNFHSLAHDMTCGDQFYGLDAPKISIRSAFVPPAAKVFVRADYSQLELRIMAHFSGDRTLIHMLQNPEPNNLKDDPFTMLASKWYRKAPDTVLVEERTNCKNLVYGLLYGSGAKKLASDLRMCEEAAKIEVARFKSMLPRLMEWLDGIVIRAREEKPIARVTTISARHRYFPDLHSKNNDDRAAAERQAVNTVCQGSAADIFKTAVVRVIDTLRTKYLIERCQLVLTVHDECVFECDARSAKAIAQIVRHAMESVANEFNLAVPLPVKVQIGSSLGDDAFAVVPRPSSRLPSAANTPAQSPIKSRGP